jgi:hypothetical protein
MPAPTRTASNDALNCPARSRIRNRAGGGFTEIHQEIADLLHSPRPVRVGGHAGDVDLAGADLHHEEAVQLLEGHRAVHMEEDGRSRWRASWRLARAGTAATSCRCARFGAGGIFRVLRTRRIADALIR